MSIPRHNPGRKQGSSTARMSKTTSNSPSNLEKRDQDQHESQDTNPTDSNYPRGKFSSKKVLQPLSKFPCENYYGPHPSLFFLQPHRTSHGSLMEQNLQEPESTCPLDTAQH